MEKFLVTTRNEILSDIDLCRFIAVVELRVLKIRLLWIRACSLLHHRLKIFVQFCALLAFFFVFENMFQSSLEHLALGFPHGVILYARETDEELGILAGPCAHQLRLAAVDDSIADIIGLKNLIILPRSKRAVFHVKLSKRHLAPARTAADCLPDAIGTDA